MKRLYIRLSFGIVILFIIGFLVLLLAQNTSPEEVGAPSGTESSRFFFFGESTPSENQPAEENTDLVSPREPARATFRQISPNPISGARFVTVDDTVFIEYVERATGHVIRTAATTTETFRRTNTTIPRIQEVFWNGDDHVILRYLREGSDDIQTFLGRITGTSSESSLVGDFLPINIPTLVSDPLSTTFFYLQPTQSGSRGITQTPTRAGSQIFSLPFRELVPQWPHSQILTLTTKASARTAGHMWFVRSDTGELQRILKDIRGLTTNTNPTATKILYSEVHSQPSNTTFLSVYDTLTETSASLPFVTLPEKCTWSRTNPHVAYCGIPETLPEDRTIPDAWYRGSFSFKDSLWRVDVGLGTTEQVPLDTSILNQPQFDITNIALDSTERFVLFINKEDGIGWILQLPIEEESVSDPLPPTTEDL